MRVKVWTLIDAPPSSVSALYVDYRRWPAIYPLISGVRLLRTQGSKLVLQVEHREGLVVNELTVRSAHELELWESKRRYDARFVNHFLETPRGTILTVVGEIELKGWARLLRPVLTPVVRRRMERFQLQPLKRAAETECLRNS